MKHFTRLIAASLASSLAACASQPLKQAASFSGFATTPSEPADFVVEKRSEAPVYIPVGVAPPARAAVKPLTGVKAVEAELDAQRAANEAKATEAKTLGATPAPLLPVVPQATN